MLEFTTLAVYAFAAPFLSYFALLTFVAATLIQSFVILNHSRTVAAYYRGKLDSLSQVTLLAITLQMLEKVCAAVVHTHAQPAVRP